MSSSPSPTALHSEEETRERILGDIVPLPAARVSLLVALDRFAAQEGRATHSLPGFDNSSMDGYAVRIAPEAGSLPAGTQLRVSGEQPAGASRGLHVAAGHAVRIFTGAPVPEGTGAVVMQEDVERTGDEIVLRENVATGEYIRRAGGDVARGQTLFPAGSRLTAQRLGLLASQGLEEVEIGRPPRVAILPTGDELRAPGEPLGAGEIYETNGVTLAALASSLVGPENVVVLPRAVDTPADLDAKLAAGLADRDVLIVAGGVSVGERDFVKERLQAAGVRLDLWRVAIQPGKPFLYGKVEGRQKEGEDTSRAVHVFGLPGNPVSAFVTFLLFVRPALWRLMGAGTDECLLPGVAAVAGEELVQRGSRPHFLRGSLDREGRFFLGGRQESHALFGLSRSEALVRVEAGTTISVGAPVRALVW